MEGFLQVSFNQTQPSGNIDDPLRKHEDFAVSLRKKRKQVILAGKRKRLPLALQLKEENNAAAAVDLSMNSSPGEGMQH